MKFHATGGGSVGPEPEPVIDKTMAKRIATQLGWAPIDNLEWKYNPMTGEPLVEGWPLYSGLPQKIRMSERSIQISDIIPVKSSHLEGHIMNEEYTPGEADAWINGYRSGKKTREWEKIISWVDLEDEEIESLARYADKHAAPFHLEFARAISRQLKERNT